MGALARVTVCRSELKLFDVGVGPTDVALAGGELGRYGLGLGGLDGAMVRALWEIDAVFFFPENGRRNDHSDSNWTESVCDPIGV